MSRKFIYLLACFCLPLVFHQDGSGQKTSTRTDQKKSPPVIASMTVDGQTGMIEGRVVFVYDGDTVRIEASDRQVYSLRLQGIDAPEDKQDFSKKSRKALEKLIEGKDVRAVLYKKDPYDRYVGSVYLNGEDVALKQIGAGMAWHYKRYGSEQPPEERKRYAQAELAARAAKIGLWKDEYPTPPWDYREGKKSSVQDKNRKVQPTNKTVQTPGSKQPAREYRLGPRGGCYYVSASGRKVYVKDKTLCGVQ